jgi:branched-chain amino acid transport system permease protein
VLNEANLTGEPVIGLTEIVLALAMIAVLILKPGGLFPTREIGALLTRRMEKSK